MSDEARLDRIEQRWSLFFGEAEETDPLKLDMQWLLSRARVNVAFDEIMTEVEESERATKERWDSKAGRVIEMAETFVSRYDPTDEQGQRRRLGWLREAVADMFPDFDSVVKESAE